MYSTTLGRVRITVVAVENPQVFHILDVCAYSCLIRHAKRMCRFILSPVACLAVPYSSRFSE
jgi:hypothetical protein